jgi:hydrogenase expression/formation protein HypD
MNNRIQELTRAIGALAEKIGRPLRLMEVCGTHTVAVFRHGIRGLLPEGISLLSGPGCPVCVTSAGDVDAAIAISKEAGVVLCTFGDMMRVPGGRRSSLYNARAEGADVRVVYSPTDALKETVNAPDRKVVFFATGFETTPPGLRPPPRWFRRPFLRRKNRGWITSTYIPCTSSYPRPSVRWCHRAR